MIQVSIIVPIFNIEEKLLRKCIESLLNQTIKDIEIFLVDDGSTNNALDVCNFYKDKKNLFVIHQENQGVSVARNTGLKKASGKWIMFVDPDDELLPDSLEVLLKEEDNESDIISGSYIQNDNGQLQEKKIFNQSVIFLSEDEKKDIFIHLLWKTSNIGAPWGKLYKKSLIDNYSLSFKPELRRSQDIIFNLYAYFFAKKIKYINKSVYIYNNEHMSSFHHTYKKNLDEFYYLFAVARYQWMCETKYFEKEIYCEYYKNGCYKILLQLLSLGPLHKDNKISLKERYRKANYYRDQKCFDILNERKGVHTIRLSLKENIFNLMIKYRKWFLLFIYWYMKKS